MKLEEIARDWTPPDGLGYSGLRPVRLAHAGYAMVGAAVLVMVGSLVLATFLWNKSLRQDASRQRLEGEGVVTAGSVVRVWRSGGKENTPNVSYQFSADGQNMRGSSPAPPSIWRTLHPGDSIEVRYVPGDPRINHPAAWRMEVVPIWLAGLIPAMFAIIPVMFWRLIRCQWRLLAEGRPAPGVVVKTRRKGNNVIVSYEFKVLSGAVQKGRSHGGSRLIQGEGTLVSVLYDPENPRRSALYPMQYVRLEGVSRPGSR